jgi:hypothetical protein
MIKVLIILALISLFALVCRFKAISAHQKEIDIYTRAEIDRMNKTEKN